MDETLFAWAHISDIHFGHGDASHGWDQAMVMDELRRDIAQRRAPARLDAIFVTGDVAFSGAGRSPDEYDKARAWLLEAGKAAGVGPEWIFVVPGNHDVNRNVDNRSKPTGRLVRDLRSRQTPAASLDDVLRDAEERALLAGRMEAFLEFAKEFGPWAGRDPMPPAPQRLYWVRPIEGRGLRVRLAGLNSALLCKDDEDVGRLRLGKEQLAKTLSADRAPNEIIVVMTHHPLRKGWLGDEAEVDRWIRNHAQLHLSGHVHEAESEEARSGAGGSFVRVVAGAAHNDQLPAWIPATHGYSFGELRRGPGGQVVLRLYPRLWSPSNAKFVIDVHGVPEDSVSEGSPFTEHVIANVVVASAGTAPASGRGEAPPPTTAPVVQGRWAPRVDGPLKVFVSFAKADEADAAEVEKRLLLINRKYTRRGLLPLVEGWSARSLGAGQDARKEIQARVATADVVVLLVSSDYLVSSDLEASELRAAVERDGRAEARVLPILLRPCDFHDEPFAGLRFLPFYMDRDDYQPRPVSEMNRDKAFLEIEEGIQAAVEAWRAKRA